MRPRRPSRSTARAGPTSSSARSLGKLTRYLIGRLAVQQALIEAQGEEWWFVTREELVDWMEQGGFLGGRDKDRCLYALDASLEKLRTFGFIARDALTAMTL